MKEGLASLQPIVLQTPIIRSKKLHEVFTQIAQPLRYSFRISLWLKYMCATKHSILLQPLLFRVGVLIFIGQAK